jgi:hypothetical protein
VMQTVAHGNVMCKSKPNIALVFLEVKLVDLCCLGKGDVEFLSV